MVNNDNKGFVLVCKRSGALDSVIRDDYNIFSGNRNNIYDFFEQDYKSELEKFLYKVHDFRSYLENSIKIKEKNDNSNFYLAGAPYYENAIIIGSSTDDFSDLFDEVQENLISDTEVVEQVSGEEACVSNIDNSANPQNISISQFKELQDRLELKEIALINKNKELEQFAHIVSHDLKAPLSQSKLIVHLLSKELQKENYNKEITELFKMLIVSTNHMSDLIDSIQLYSKSGFLVQELSHFNLSDVISDVLEKLRTPQGVTIEYDKNLPEIYGNKLHLHQVLLQLISNAIRFHHKSEGKISITFKDEDDLFVFEVIDDGPGIPEDYHQRIFEIFNKSHLRSEKEGSGVGLSIVKKLVEGAGGAISLDSKVGRGSNFKFIWPKIREVGNLK